MSKLKIRQLILGCQGLFLCSLGTLGMAQTGSHFIHGSWVNVRATPESSGRVVDQLPTNTPIVVKERKGTWCEITFRNQQTGFVACNLIGNSALTLSQVVQQPARAFWVAPSPNRLAAYGNSLVPPAHLQLEALKKTYQYGQEVNYPAVAEFEAAKKLMRAGVRLNPEMEIHRDAPVDLAKVLATYRLVAPVAKPSLFRTHTDVVLESEGNADSVVSVAGSKVALEVVGKPTAWFSRHNGPEIEGVTGFWDVGSAALNFSPGLSMYSVAANGLMARTIVSRVPYLVGGAGHYCGARYLTKSFDWSMYSRSGEGDYISSPAPGSPKLSDTSLVLTSFTLANSINRKVAKIKTQSVRVDLPPLNIPSQGRDTVDPVKPRNPKATLYEIDLDADGVPDIVMLDQPLSFGEISVEVIYNRRWFVNIGGQWFSAGEWEDEDCT